MRLSTNDWKPFFLKKLYDIKMGNGFDKNKMSEENPSVNLVSRVSYNNGVDIKVDLIEGVSPFPKGVLTVALGGCYLGSCFVQEEPFYTGQNVAVMTPICDKMSHSVNLFISTLVRYESKIKYYAFGRELNTHIRTDFTVSLPVQHNADGSLLVSEQKEFSDDGYIPDWGYMEEYITSLKHKPLKTRNARTPKRTFNVNDWKEFYVSNLFTVERGDLSSLNEVEIGDVPIVSASGENEGISFYGAVDAPYTNNITFSMNGVNTGFTCYHSYGFNANADCGILLQKFEMNPYIGQFLATIIGLLRIKYSYGRKMTKERMENEIIRLPVKRNPDGSILIDDNRTFSPDGYIPDWKFMEDYIKALPYGDRI